MYMLNLSKNQVWKYICYLPNKNIQINTTA